MMRHDVLWYDLMWFDVISCNVRWWHDVMCCNMLWCDVIWYAVMQWDVMWCEVMRWDVMKCNVMWCEVIWCDMMWCDVKWYTVIWCNIISSSVMSRMNGQHHLPCYFPRNHLKYKYVQFPLCRIHYCRSAHNLLCEEEEEVCFTNIKDNASLPQIFFTRSIIVPLFV